MNLHVVNLQIGTIQTVTLVEKTTKQYQVLSSSKESRSSLNLNKNKNSVK